MEGREVKLPELLTWGFCRKLLEPLGKRGLGDSLSAANVAGSELAAELLLTVKRHRSPASCTSMGCSGSRRLGGPMEHVGLRLRDRREGPPLCVSTLGVDKIVTNTAMGSACPVRIRTGLSGVTENVTQNHCIIKGGKDL